MCVLDIGTAMSGIQCLRPMGKGEAFHLTPGARQMAKL